MVSPDVGGVVRARAIAKRLDADLAIIDKRRERAGVSEVMNIIGDVKDRDCILVDDIVEFRRHAVQRGRGADGPGRQVGLGLCHPRRAVGRRRGPRRRLADGEAGDHRIPSRPTEAVRVSPNIRQLTIAPLMAEAMRRISEETSVSSLFD